MFIYMTRKSDWNQSNNDIRRMELLWKNDVIECVDTTSKLVSYFVYWYFICMATTTSFSNTGSDFMDVLLPEPFGAGDVESHRSQISWRFCVPRISLYIYHRYTSSIIIGTFSVEQYCRLNFDNEIQGSRTHGGIYWYPVIDVIPHR